MATHGKEFPEGTFSSLSGEEWDRGRGVEQKYPLNEGGGDLRVNLSPLSNQGRYRYTLYP